MHLLDALTGWLYANVLGNLIASAVTTGIALTWHHRRTAAAIGRLHARVDHLHRKADQAGGGGADGGSA